MTNYFSDKTRSATQISRFLVFYLSTWSPTPTPPSGRRGDQQACRMQRRPQGISTLIQIGQSLCLLHQVSEKNKLMTSKCKEAILIFNLGFVLRLHLRLPRLTKCIVLSRTLTIGILRGLHSSHILLTVLVAGNHRQISYISTP